MANEFEIGSATYGVRVDAGNFNSGLVDVERRVNRTFNNISKVMTGVMVGGAGVAAAGFTKFFNDAIQQQKSFQETFTLLPDVSKEAFGGIANDAKQLAARLNVEWKDMSKGLYDAISAGIPQENILTFMEQAAKAAVGGVATLTESVNAGTTAVNAMRAQGLDASRAFDILFSTIRKGKTTLPELASSIGFLLPVANSLNVSFEQISAMISTLTASGIRTRVAMTSIRAGLSELADPAYKAGAALEELAGTTFYNLIQQGKDVGDILNMLFESVGQEKFAQLFGLESRAGMASLVGEGYKKYTEDLNDARNSIGQSNLAFEKMAEVILFQMGVASKTVKQTLTDLAGIAIPMVEKLFSEKLLPSVEKFHEWFVDNKDFLTSWFEETWNTAWPIIDDFTHGFVEIGKAAWSFISFITENKVLLIAALVAMGVAMTVSFGPAAPVIVGVGMLITLFGDLKSKWDDIVKSNPSGNWFAHGQALVSAIASGMKSAAASLWNALLESFSSLRKLLPFSDAAEGPLSDLTARGASIITTLAAGVEQSGGSLGESLRYVLMSGLNVLNLSQDGWFNAGMNLATTLANGIVSGGIAIYNAMVGVFTQLRKLLPFSDAEEGPLSNLTQSGESIVITLSNGIKIASGRLTDEARAALSDLEIILSDYTWTPTGEDIEDAIAEGVSVTNIIEQSKGLIRSINWGGVAEEAIDDAENRISSGFNRLVSPMGYGGLDPLEATESSIGAGASALGGIGGGVGAMNADEFAASIAAKMEPIRQGILKAEQEFEDSIKLSLLPEISDAEIEAAFGGIVTWIENALAGTIDLSGLALPAWLSDDDGEFAWPTIGPFPIL